MKSFHTGLQPISLSIRFLPAAFNLEDKFLLLCRRLSPFPAPPPPSCPSGYFGGPVPQWAVSPSRGWYPVSPWSSCNTKAFLRNQGVAWHNFPGEMVAWDLLSSSFSCKHPGGFCPISFASFNVFWPVPVLSPNATSFPPAWAAHPSL